MNNEAAFRAAQRRYDAMLPDPEPSEAPEQPEPDFTGVRLRLKRKQARIGLPAMARELDLYPGYLHDLESGQLPWPDDVVNRYEQALTNL